MLRISTALAVALSAGVVLMVTGPSARAADGDSVILGQINSATNTTEVTNSSFGATTLYATGSGSNSIGLWGNGSLFGVRGSGGTGVYGTGATNGVEGHGPTGVYGSGMTGNGVWGETGASAASGVYGQNDSTGYGVFGSGGIGLGGVGTTIGAYGENDSTGYGVEGTSANGTGVLADSANGTALDVRGRSTFTTAGDAVIASGQKKVTVTLTGVTATDFVLATVQGSGSFYVKNASAAAGKFTIYINKAPISPATVIVAYFVISA
jgi:hypothetical protein